MKKRKRIREKPKRRNALKVTRPRGSPVASLNKKVALLKRERDEALKQQIATSKVLQVISSSPGKLEPVFKTMLENATRICEAQFGNLWLVEGAGFRSVAMHNLPPALADERMRNQLIVPDSDDPLAQLAATKRKVHIADARTEKVYKKGFGPFVALVEHGKARTLLVVPLLRKGKLVGAFAIFRQEVRPFSNKQIELVSNFAAQAVIAIENTRLLSELRQRTDDLTESLEQQTATSEVLKIISSSPGELEPVFNAMLENATRICDAKFGTLFRYDGELFHRVAGLGTPPALVEFQRQRGPFKYAGSMLGRVARTKMVAHSADELADPDPGPSATHGGARSVVGVPMLKDNELVGAIVIYRQEVRPFSDKQIELVQNFAAQAVIAIENTRLLNELRQRTDDLPVAGAADRDLRGAEGHLKFARRTWSPYSTPCWRMRPASARPTSASCSFAKAMHFARLRSMACRRLSSELMAERELRSRPGPEIPAGSGCSTQNKSSTLPTCAKIVRYRERRSGRMLQRSMSAGVRTLLIVPMLKDSELDRRDHDLPPGGPPVHRQADRAGQELRRPGRDRHRERAAAQRAAPAH